MTTIDILGWCAAGATMLTFSMRAMVRLRVLALVSNLCFIGYGATAGLAPILVLHLCLLPCNLYRLSECLAARGTRAAPAAAPRLDPSRDWIVYRQPGLRTRRGTRRARPVVGAGAGSAPFPAVQALRADARQGLAGRDAGPA